MAKPEPTFGMDQLFEELAAGLATSEDGWAMSELVEALGVGRKSILKRLHMLRDQGRLQIGRKRIADIAGRRLTVVAYKLRTPGPET